MKWVTTSAAATMALLILAVCADAFVASAGYIAINENGVRRANSTTGNNSPVTNNNYDSSENNTTLTTGDDSSVLGGLVPGGAILSSAATSVGTAGDESPVSITGDDNSTSTGGFSTIGNNNATTVSNVLKTKHDTVKNSINNVRSVATPVVNNNGDGSSTAVTTNIDEAPSGESAINTTRSNIKSSATAVGNTAGDNSPVAITVNNTSSEQTGNLDLSVGQVDAFSVSSLSATISGNSGAAGDPIPGVDVKLGGSGNINGTFGSQGGITNVQQNTGANSVLQGSVSLAMKPPALN